MNFQNDEMLTSPNLSYTSRDFTSIFNELMASIPYLTSEWDPKDKNDPGVVLIKLLSMMGDMLSYNLDKAALEAFPRSVTQRANAQQIFRLVGYKMHWWNSPQVEVTIVNNNVFPITIGKYNTFSTRINNITYCNLEEFDVPGNTNGSGYSYKGTLIQGTPVTPVMKSSIKPENYNSAWHDSYDYNFLASDIINDRLYLKYKNIDENSITLIDNDESQFALNEWKLVDNINTSENMDKIFEFDVDENNIPFIQLPSYWKEKYVITKFKLFFILSDGENGEIEENTLMGISPAKCYVDDDNISISSALQDVVLFNTASTYGKNPQTCVEARNEAEKYVNTLDTLVICNDFAKAIRRMDSVANCVVTDLQTDPNGSEMGNYELNAYIVRKDDYNTNISNYIYPLDSSVFTDTESQLYIEKILGELSRHKLMPYNINVYLENKVNWIDWSITGQIYLRHPIDSNENQDLMTRIDNNLKNRFNVETLEFNEPINYMDVIECIMKTDKNIWHVDLDTSAIQYTKVLRNIHGSPSGNVIKNKYMIFDPNGNYTGYYLTSFGCVNITQHNELSENIGADTSQIGLTKTISMIGTENPGGSGYGKNSGNRIVREDGSQYVIGLFDEYEAREYEVENKLIWDRSGATSIYTGYYIDTKPSGITIKKYNSDDPSNPIDTGYAIKYDSRMYLSDGSDANRHLVSNVRQISQLCTLREDDILSIKQIFQFSEDEIEGLVNSNILREVWDIYNSEYGTWTNLSIDKLTGEIFILRGNVWYSYNKSYDEETGNICDTNGPVIFNPVTYTMSREAACREDVTGEYIQYYELRSQELFFDIFLGEDADGNVILDDVGKPIQSFPIKPGSLFVYVTTEDGEEVLSDTETGRMHGTGNIMNGYGSIDYDAGEITFTLNQLPITSLKIMYKINELNYAHYNGIDTQKLFVRPEFLRSNTRK